MTDELLTALVRAQREALDEKDELSRPFDQGERAAILDRAFTRIEAAASPSNVVELAPRWHGAFIGSLLAVAAAATLVWWSWPEPEHEMVASVPDYSFTQLGGGIAQQRSEPLSVDADMPELKLRANSNIDWVLTPATPTRDSIAVALLARSDAREVIFVPTMDAQISQQGAVRLRGPLDRHISLADGGWTLTLFIRASDSAGPWQSLALRVIIVGDE